MEAAKLLEHDLKTALLALTMDLFGSGIVVVFLGSFEDLRTLTNCDTKNDSDTSPGLMYGGGVVSTHPLDIPHLEYPMDILIPRSMHSQPLGHTLLLGSKHTHPLPPDIHPHTYSSPGC